MGELRRFEVGCQRVRAIAAAFAIALVAAGLSACRQTDKTDEPPPTVRLGALVALTGENAPTGQRMVGAFQMAVNEANDAGGVLGRKVELVMGDDACDPGTAVVKAHELLDHDITVSVGGVCSHGAVSVLKVFRDAGVPMIIPAANSTDLLVPQYDSVFLLSGTTKIEAQRALGVISKLDAHRLAVIDDATSFPQTLASATVDGVRQPDSKITLAAQLTLIQGANSYPGIVADVLRQHADIVFFTGYYPDAATLIKDLRAAQYPGKILLSDAATDPTLLTLLNPAQAEGIYGLTLPVPQFEPRAKEWAARYRAAYGEEPGPWTMQSYDAVRLALNAIKRAGSLDRDAVRKAIAATVPGDIELLSGTSKFNPDGTRADPAFVLVQVHDGDFTYVNQT